MVISSGLVDVYSAACFLLGVLINDLFFLQEDMCNHLHQKLSPGREELGTI